MEEMAWENGLGGRMVVRGVSNCFPWGPHREVFPPTLLVPVLAFSGHDFEIMAQVLRRIERSSYTLSCFVSAGSGVARLSCYTLENGGVAPSFLRQACLLAWKIEAAKQ